MWILRAIHIKLAKKMVYNNNNNNNFFNHNLEIDSENAACVWEKQDGKSSTHSCARVVESASCVDTNHLSIR